MASVCDFLFSADLCVANASETLDDLINGIGLPRPSSKAFVQYEDEGWDTIFALVNKAFAAAPTRLEIIAPLDPPNTAAPRTGRRVFDRQAPRQMRTHATVVATPDMAALVERVRRSGARHWFQPSTEHVPFDRLWMGSAVGDIADYDPQADGGFLFEFIPSQSPAFSPALFVPPIDEPRPGEVGLRRILCRDFIVADIDATLRTLETVFGWEPAHAVRAETTRGYRFVRMSSNHAHGASLRLIQAVDTTQTPGRDIAAAGPGPWQIHIATFDLAAGVADLERRDVRFARLPAGHFEPETVVPQISHTLGAPVVLVGETAL